MPNSSSEHSLKSSQKNRPIWNSPRQWFAHWTRYCWRRLSCLSCEQNCGTSKMRYEYQSLAKSPTPIWLSFQKSASLFECLYKSWAHCPVSTMSLCLLAQCYQHVSDLVIQFANLEITVEFLTEMDKLVQLIESPIFACKFFKWNAPQESHKNQLQPFVWHSSPMTTRNRSNSSKHYSESLCCCRRRTHSFCWKIACNACHTTRDSSINRKFWSTAARQPSAQRALFAGTLLNHRRRSGESTSMHCSSTSSKYKRVTSNTE